jgi:hypothetical protein
MKRGARNVDNCLSTTSLKFFIINHFESDLVLFTAKYPYDSFHPVNIKP